MIAAQVAFVGRPNSGKSSLYNAVTGGDAHVGNFPGVTVDILECEIALDASRTVACADLPGLYSLEAIVDPATDEGVARRFLDACATGTTPLVVVQVVDATQLALGLRMTRELLRLSPSGAAPRLAVAVTQRDLLERDGSMIDAGLLEAALGVPVAYTSSLATEAQADVILAIARALDGEPKGARVAAGDLDPTALAARVTRTLRRPGAATAVTERFDRLLLHPVLGPLLFLGLMSLVFALVFLVADPASALMDRVVGVARGKVQLVLGRGLLGSFMADGLLGGAGTVLAFMPQIVILTVVMEILEASGYLARGAFLVDRVLRALGLSGRAFVPLLMGHACAVPVISATRILRDPRERLTTILVLPLMTCAGRIPTYALVISTFFAGRGAWFRSAIFVGLYALGILAGLVASLVLRRTATKGRSLPLVLEMPRYRLPQGKVLWKKVRQSAGRFLRDVGTSILVASAALWLLLTLPMPGAAPGAPGSPAIERSVAATVGRAAEPLTAPAGFDWRINVGLIGSFGQRELMVGTLGVIFGIEDAADDAAPLALRMREARTKDGRPVYTARTGLAVLVFFVLACQCMSTLAAIKRETKSLAWPAFVLGYTYAVAYAGSVLTYQLAGMLGVT